MSGCRPSCQPIVILSSWYKWTPKPSFKLIHNRLLALLHRQSEFNSAYISEEWNIIILGHVYIYEKVGDLKNKSTFLVADLFGLHFILETKSKNQQILTILPTQLDIILYSLWSTAFLSASPEANNSTSYSDGHDGIQMTTRKIDFRVPKQLSTQARSGTAVADVTTTRPVLRLELNSSVIERELFSSGTMEVNMMVLFQDLLTDVSNERDNIPKRMLPGQLCDELTTVINVGLLLLTKIEESKFSVAVTNT